MHRGLDMTLAQIVFEGPANNMVDERKDYREMRYISIGLPDGRMVGWSDGRGGLDAARWRPPYY